MSRPRDLSEDDLMIKLVELAIDQGWVVKPTNNNKLMWYSPDKSVSPIPSPTRLVGRSYKNVMTSLQRAGLDVSSLKSGKGKPVVLVNGMTPESIDNLSDSEIEFVHEQAVLIDSTANKVAEMTNIDMTNEQKSGLMNDALSQFLVGSAQQMLAFMDKVLPAVSCGHEADENNLKKLQEAEQLYLETCQELDTLRPRLEKAEQKISELGAQLKETVEARTQAEERAHKAESKLRTLRSALSLED